MADARARRMSGYPTGATRPLREEAALTRPCLTCRPGQPPVHCPAMRYPVICVQAFTQSWNGIQLLWPLPHCSSGVFQNLMVLKYASGALA